jgi:hypothetical protein
MVGISGWALGKITSSLTSDEQKNNVGLSLKFEVKALKVIDCKFHVFEVRERHIAKSGFP